MNGRADAFKYLRLVAAAATTFAAGVGAKAKEPPQDMYYLLELLKSNDVQERRSVAQQLGAMGFDVATPALIEALDDSDTKVRLLAAESLGKIGDKRAVEPLLERLPYAEPGIQRFILGSLGKIGDIRALAPMVEVLETSLQDDVRASAAYGLGELGDTAAVPALTAALADDYKWVRFEACGALRKLKAAEAASALERVAADDEDEQVRLAAKKALEEIRR